MTGNELVAPSLTDEDRTLLERWKSIYPRSSQSVSSEDSRSTWSMSDCADQPSLSSVSPCQTGLPSTEHNNGTVVNHRLQGQLIDSCFLPGQVHPSLHLNGTNYGAACRLSALTSLTPPAVSFPGYLPPTETTQPSFSNLLAQTNNDIVQQAKNSVAVLTSLDLSEYGEDRETERFDGMKGNCLSLSYSDALHATTLALLPSTTPLFGNPTASPQTVDASFLYQSQLAAGDTVLPGWICGRDHQRAGDTELTSLQVVGEIATSVGGGYSVPSRPVASSLVNGSRSVSDDLRVITSQLMKSHVEDLTLHDTPRGSGAGYGVGCDDLFTTDLPSSELHASQEQSAITSLSLSLHVSENFSKHTSSIHCLSFYPIPSL